MAKQIPDEEHRCIYVSTWTNSRGEEVHSRCKRKKSKGSDYCLNHRKRLENDVELAKPLDSHRAVFEYDSSKSISLGKDRDIPKKMIVMMEMGHSQTVAAKSLGVAPSTITKWCRKANELIEQGKTDEGLVKWYVNFIAAKYRAAGMVENALFRMATEDHNLQAALKWLATRVPEEWSDKKEVTIDGMIQIKNSFDKMSDEELRRAVQKQLNDAYNMIEVQNLAESE